MNIHIIGEPLIEGVTEFPEGNHFDVDSSGAAMTLFWPSPTQEEIRNITGGHLKFGIMTHKNVIFFLVKYGFLLWQDAAYSVKLSKDYKRCECEEGKGLGLRTILVDANTGLVTAMRLTALPTELSNRLTAAIDKQEEMPFDKSEYNMTINDIYMKLGTEEMVEEADYTEDFQRE